MAYRFTPADRGAFKRCRRQWDLGARERRNYEPARPAAAPDLEAAVRDALAVYYFPGMWDWQRSVVLPLVVQGLARSAGRGPPAGEEELAAAEALLRRYFEWAPAVDRFSPVQVEHPFEVNLPDPAGGDRELVLADGRPVRYQGRVDLLAGDEHDRYWVVAHRVVDRFAPAGDLLLDEELVAACWALEQVYPGMRIAGTVHNELRLAPEPPAGTAWSRLGRRLVHPDRRDRRSGHQRGLPQHEASGGGRSLPYARRGARARSPADPAAVIVEGDGPFRRTRVPRDRAELAAMGTRLAAEALEMVDPDLPVYPSPSPEHCGSCQFVAPCLAMERGGDVGAVLEAGYRDRGPERVEPGRLGAATWGIGRGAAPPRFDTS
jgi:PD-(D/E)XK nuclease superfamily